MPIKQLSNPAGLWGEPLSSGLGLNDTICIEVMNNSGAHMSHGDVVVWDTSTALSTVTTTTTGSQQLAVTATSYAVTSSASFGTTGPIVAASVTTTIGPGTPQYLFGVISAKADGTHVTVAWARAGAAGSLPAGTVLFVPPSTANGSGKGSIALPGTTGAVVPAVTYSTTAAANDPNVAGVVCLTGDSSTSNAVVAPGATFLMAIAGQARVNIGGGTVAAGGLLCTAAAAQPGIADDTPATIGCLLGVALESQANVDANNTIRAIIKIG